LNFVALLLVGEVLEDGGLGEAGAGFPQSPLLPRDAWLPRLMPRTDLHAGVLLAVLAAIIAHGVLWRMRWGFAIRTAGASRRAARYAGLSLPRTVMGLMLGAGATAGLAGAVQVQGIHHRLIDGFTGGFGFVAVAIALLGGLNPLALIPAALLFGLLETGALSMQRQVGVPSSLVAVIEGMAMLFVLAITARNRAAARV
ncbi:ABC transporter permease, partial [Acidisphaera rubrifaciens]|uniref:ABC transporter permease n=1 Tax=Acidisphaera rubrifaciens TaxID=50715 RepID=UPI000662BFAC